LKNIAHTYYLLDKTTADPKNVSLATILSLIQHLESEVKKLDIEIAKNMMGIPQTPS
jgi:hypothetical protein